MASDLLPVVFVIFPEEDEDVEEALNESIALQDDAYWARFAYSRFSWTRFMRWWVARRWIVPRDIRKR